MGHKKNCDRFSTLVFGYPMYSMVWMGGIFSLMGDYFNSVATLAVMKKLGGDKASGLYITAYLVIQKVPPLLFGPLVGKVIDRLDGRFTMIVCDVMRVPLSLAYLFVKSEEHLYFFFIFSFIKNIFNAFYSPSRRRLIPQVVPDTILSLCSLVDGVTYSSVMGFASFAGGGTYTLLGSKWCFIVDASSYVLSATCVFVMMLPCMSPSVKAQTKIANDTGMDDDEDDMDYDEEDEEVADTKGLLRNPAANSSTANPPPTPAEPMVPSTVLAAKKEDKQVMNRELLGSVCAKGLSALLYGSMALFTVRYAQLVWVVGEDGAASAGILQLIRGGAEMMVPIFTESIVLPSHKKTRRSTIGRVLTTGFIVEAVGIIMIAGSMYVGRIQATAGILVFMVGNAIRCAGEANIWVFSCLLVPLTASELGMRSELGKIFTRENWMASGGEVLGTVFAGLAEYYLSWDVGKFAVSSFTAGLAVLIGFFYYGFYRAYWMDQHKFMRREIKKAFTDGGPKRSKVGVTRASNSIQEVPYNGSMSIYHSHG